MPTARMESNPCQEQAALMLSMGFTLVDTEKPDHSRWHHRLHVTLTLPDKMIPTCRNIMSLALKEVFESGQEEQKQTIRKALGLT